MADLQERLARGDTAFTNKLLYFSASLHGTSQYWQQRRRELRALVEYMVNDKKGLPLFFNDRKLCRVLLSPIEENTTTVYFADLRERSRSCRRK